MTLTDGLAPKSMPASEYVLALFAPSDNVAILICNRRLGRTQQRILKAGTIANPSFQAMLLEQNRAGADVFVGMNPIKEGAYNRTKQSLKEIRHVYLDIDREGDQAIEVIRASLDIPTPNFVLNTSPGKYQVVWRIEGRTCKRLKHYCTTWRITLAAIWPRPTRRGSYDYPASPIAN
jgi:DNA primase RepB-like protein